MITKCKKAGDAAAVILIVQLYIMLKMQSAFTVIYNGIDEAGDASTRALALMMDDT